VSLLNAAVKTFALSYNFL